MIIKTFSCDFFTLRVYRDNRAQFSNVSPLFEAYRGRSELYLLDHLELSSISVPECRYSCLFLPGNSRSGDHRRFVFDVNLIDQHFRLLSSWCQSLGRTFRISDNEDFIEREIVILTEEDELFASFLVHWDKSTKELELQCRSTRSIWGFANEVQGIGFSHGEGTLQDRVNIRRNGLSKIQLGDEDQEAYLKRFIRALKHEKNRQTSLQRT